MRLLRPFLLVFGGCVFAFSYVLCLPCYVICFVCLRNWRPVYGFSRRLAQWWLITSGLSWRVRYSVPLRKDQGYVFCANHSSYLDVPTLFLIRSAMVFVGKSSLAKLPLFGYTYKRMHILVDRENLSSKYQVLSRAQQALQQGMSLVFFPEGGIRSKTPPRLATFQEGAFRTAIEAQVPIVPVTLLYNWMILPKYHRKPHYTPYTHRIVLYVHAPISTQGLRIQDATALKKKVHTQIQRPLQICFSTLFSPRHVPID